MPPIRSKPLREADVWLDENLWGDEPAPRRRRADDPRDPAGRRSAPAPASGFFDHEREPEAEIDFVVRRGRGRDGDEHMPSDHARWEATGSDARRAATDPPEAERPERDPGDAAATVPGAREDPSAVPVPLGPVPGLLRRPLVEVQRTLPTPDRRRSFADGPDRLAMWAVALAVLTLISAIVTAHA